MSSDSQKSQPQEPLSSPHGRQPVFNVPFSIVLLIGLFMLVHAVRGLLTLQQDWWFVNQFGFVPVLFANGLWDAGLRGVLSFLTYNFLHGDSTHLIINSIWMLAMGSAVAKRVGDFRFYLFSFFCGLFAALAHLLTHYGEATPVIGASGAISGHMAAAIRFVFSVDNSREGSRLLHSDLASVPVKNLFQVLRDVRVLAILVIFVVTNVISGLGYINVTGEEGALLAWEAHIGGFIAGLVLFSLFDRPGEPGKSAGNRTASEQDQRDQDQRDQDMRDQD